MSPEFFYILLFTSLFSFGFNYRAFSQKEAYHSKRIKINSYGTREQTTTLVPNNIVLNLSDSVVLIQSEHPGVSEFLGYQEQFEITRMFGSGFTTRVCFTNTDYVFTFDTRMKALVISKKDISPQVHSVWLEEITNVQ